MTSIGEHLLQLLMPVCGETNHHPHNSALFSILFACLNFQDLTSRGNHQHQSQNTKDRPCNGRNS